MKTPAYTEDNIKQLSALEHIRFRSSMYVGAADLDANRQIFKEFIDNSLDESILDDHMYHIKIVFFTNGIRYQAAIIDHGRGIPCNKLKILFTEANTSGKYDAAAYNGISIGTFGVGSKASCALSRQFTAISKRLDGFAGLTVESGIIKDYQVLNAIDKNEDSVGTTVLFEPDDIILKRSHSYITDPQGLKKTLGMLEYVGAFKPNTRITVHQVNKLLPASWFSQTYQEKWAYLQGATGTIIYTTPEGITPFEYVRSKFEITDKAVWSFMTNKQIDLSTPKDKFGCVIHLACGTKCAEQNGLVTAVNANIFTDLNSSHVSVLIDLIKPYLRVYLDEDDSELQLYFNTKYILPLHGYISVLYKEATFINQTKDAFKDLEFANMYRMHLHKVLEKESVETWETLYSLVIDDLTKKFTQSSNRSLNLGKNLKNAAMYMETKGCYIPCKINNSDVTELLITEGNSAGDYVKQVRNATFQAVLKMRGKPINAITADATTLRSNDVYQDLLRLFGVGPRDTDLKNFNFKRVGLLADADPDGYHILALLIGCIYKINPLILESGRVFIANPPLYVMESNDKNLFLRDQKALDDSRVMIYDNFFGIELHNTTNDKHMQLTGRAYRDFVYLVRRIGTVITDVANKLVVDPFILEQLVKCVDYLAPATLDCKKIKETLYLESCSYHEIANTLLMVAAGMEISIPLGRLVTEIRAYILPELQPIHWGAIIPVVTTKATATYVAEPLTYMQLYKIFNDIDTAYPVRRLKGLGECTREQLLYTCVDPTTRTFSTITGLGDVEKLYKLLGVDTELRKTLIMRDLNDLFQNSN